MDTTFNVFDVLRIAEEVERKAARFYLGTAREFVDSQRRGICYDLASWRVRHEQAWNRIRRDYSERTGEFGRFDPDDYVSSNPQVMAGLTWFGTGWEVRGRLFAHMTAQQILRDARRRANEILIFYQGLKDFACDAESRTMIDNMIAEEGRHISALNRQVDRMQALSRTSSHAEPLCAAV